MAIRNQVNTYQTDQAEIDHLLLPLLSAADNAEQERLLANLLADKILPKIEEIIRYHPSFWSNGSGLSQYKESTQDIRNDAFVQVLRHIRRWIAGHGSPPIRDTLGLTVHITRHAIAAYWRKQKPLRNQLKDKVRYVLTHQPGLAIWEIPKEGLVCGLADWKANRGTQISAIRQQRLSEAQAQWRSQVLPEASQNGAQMAKLLIGLFQESDGPIPLTALVSLLADYFGLQEQTVSLDDSGEGQDENFVSETTAITDSDTNAVEGRLYLEKLWIQICRLPLDQRIALLLNLRYADERGLIVLLIELGIVRLTELIQELGVEPDQFLSLWNSLPLDDTQIAELLGVNRQKVINLRQRARHTLAKEMANTT